MKLRALLLDLDGTLVDTAPDMVASLNQLLTERGRGPVDYALGRAHVSDGAAGLIGVGFDIATDDPAMPALRRRFLDIYGARVAKESSVFNGFREVIEVLHESGWRWGVVTNKPIALASPLMASLQLHPPAGCLVGGDSLPRRKPHPDPLLHAAGLLKLPPQACVYVGDAPRDIEAARAADMYAVAARWGYLPDPAAADGWGADAVIGHPSELAGVLRRISAASPGAALTN